MENNSENLLDDRQETVEQEDNENIVINIPFDPNQVKISTQPYTIGQLIDRLEYEEIKLDTEFQRLPDLWDATRQSRLIESLLLQLPLPTFYFDGVDNNKWHVIDGLQRVSTLKNFVIDQTLSLQNLEFLKQLEGKHFNELPRDLQRRIKTFPITIYVVEKGTPDVVKYNIFSRINKAGLLLTAQEIRHALYQGAPANLVKELAQYDAFRRATDYKIKIKRMEDRDFVTRFVAFYLIDYKQYQPDLDSFMSAGMAKIKQLKPEDVLAIKENFQKAMQTAYDIFGRDAFRKRFTPNDARKPLNKALFEVLSVNFAQLSLFDCEKLIKRKDIFQAKLQLLMNQPDKKFLRAISQGTASKENVEKRFEDIQQIIKETLENA